MVADQERRNNDDMRALLDRVAERAAKASAAEAVPQAIEMTLKTFGFDTDDPLKIQKNMAFLDESRQRCEKFYGEMFNNFTKFAMWGVKIVFIAGVIAIAARFGLDAAPVAQWLGLPGGSP